jgi:hypothetical protein
MCPLFCCFDAEFDSKVESKICYQSPQIMRQDIRGTIESLEMLLGAEWHRLSDDEFAPPTPKRKTSLTGENIESTYEDDSSQISTFAVNTLSQKAS